MKTKNQNKYHTVGTFPKSNRKILERRLNVVETMTEINVRARYDSSGTD